MTVAREARGKGYGRELTDAVVNFAVRSGFKTIFLTAMDYMIHAGRVYKQGGFLEAVVLPSVLDNNVKISDFARFLDWEEMEQKRKQQDIRDDEQIGTAREKRFSSAADSAEERLHRAEEDRLTKLKEDRAVAAAALLADRLKQERLRFTAVMSTFQLQYQQQLAAQALQAAAIPAEPPSPPITDFTAVATSTSTRK